MNYFRARFNAISQYPSAIFGTSIILFLIIVAIYALVTIPRSEAIRLWRGGDEIWAESPRYAVPKWVNILPGVNLPVTQVLSTVTTPEYKTVSDFTSGIAESRVEIPFDFTANAFPKEVSIFAQGVSDRSRPYVSITWITPDGREIFLLDGTVGSNESYRLRTNRTLIRRLGNVNPEVGLLAKPGSVDIPLKGTYTLVVDGLLFEEESSFDVKLVVYGQAHGLAGTDHRRRDLSVALLYGTPIALAFGFLAAVGTTITTMMIAAIGVWFGGWIDGLIQRVTEVNLILPVLPLLIMVGTFYSRNIWVMLGILILLGIFSAGIKTYRAMFLPIKESPYIEAARGYGASSYRIVFLYMIPRVIPVLVPSFVLLIPSYVFLEATLALLGLGDPVLPTWGKVLSDAYSDGALFKGYYYWVLQPAGLLMLTGLGFAMLGFALDRIFNPRLRGL